MKKLIFLLITVHTLNARSQLNLKWTSTQSISAGTYKTASSYFNRMDIGAFTSASNEHFESTGDSVKGVIRKYDATTGALLWSIVLNPAVSLASFPGGGISSFTVSDDLWGIVYNTDPSTSHLIKINPNGAIDWDIVVNEINNVNTMWDEYGKFSVFGRTPLSNCGGFPCNGIAIAKYDANGQEILTRTRYTSNLRTRPSAGFVDNDGTLSVCGKKAPGSSANYNQTFVLKYASDGTLLWEKLFSVNTTEATKQDIEVDASSNIYFADADGNAVKLRKLSGTNGAVQWTKTINNSELNGFVIWPGVDLTGESIIVTTNTGMKAYNSAGTLLWSNNYIAKTGLCGTSILEVVASNVSQTEPLSNFLVQLNAATGTILLQKNLSFGNHEEYLGNYYGVIVDGPNSYMLNQDPTAPYCTRLTKLSPCSDFTYSFSATATATDVSNAGCNNGVINVNWSGTFNSWAHIEIWTDGGTDIIAQVDAPNAASYTFQNLISGSYMVKVFDESCGQQDFNVTVRCPVPTGLNATNITRNKARLNWTLPSCNAGVQLQYRLQGAPAWTTINLTASYKQLSGLTPNSLYEWQLASKCAGSNPAVYSDYSAMQTFTTSSQLLEDPEITIDNTAEIEQDNISAHPGKENAKPGFNIYPNPSDGNFIVSVNLSDDNGGDRMIQIINSSGQVVKQLNMNGQKRMSMNLKEAGTYSVQLITNRQVITKKLIVIH